MKKLVNALFVIVLICSTLLLTSTYFVDTASQSASQTLVQMEIENRVNAIVDEIQAIIPVDNDEAVDVLITKIKEDEHISSLIDTYAKQFIHDIAVEDSPAIDMNTEVHEALLNFSDEFGDVMGDVINPAYKEAIINEIVVRIDFNDYYSKALEKVRTTMNPTQLKLVQATNSVFENNSLYRVIAIVVSIVSVLSLVVLNWKSGYGLLQVGQALAISGILHGFIYSAVPYIIDHNIKELSGVFDFGLFLTLALIYTVVGFAMRFIAIYKVDRFHK